MIHDTTISIIRSTFPIELQTICTPFFPQVTYTVLGKWEDKE